VGICELSHYLAEMAGSPGLVVDVSDIEMGFFDPSTFFGLLARVRNAGGHVVVVSGPGPLTRFLSGVALANPVPVVGSLQSAWGAVRAMTGASSPVWPPPFSVVRPPWLLPDRVGAVAPGAKGALIAR
jgi:hypothetical protein